MTLKIKILFLFLLIFVISSCAQIHEKKAQTEVSQMKITSPAFENEASIPAKYTCQGENVNPELNIGEIPDGTRSLILIVDDPDAPMGTWVHWLVWNIDVISKIAENSVPKGGIQGLNDFKKNEYGGPCPPEGEEHRYFFKIYALDTELNLDESTKKKDVEEAMEGHILDKAELVGMFKKE